MGPRDQPVRFGLPYDYETGLILTDGQIGRIDKLKEAHCALLEVMHECEGSAAGNPTFSTARMQQAVNWIEMGMMQIGRAHV